MIINVKISVQENPGRDRDGSPNLTVWRRHMTSFSPYLNWLSELYGVFFSCMAEVGGALTPSEEAGTTYTSAQQVNAALPPWSTQNKLGLA